MIDNIAHRCEWPARFIIDEGDEWQCRCGRWYRYVGVSVFGVPGYIGEWQSI